MWVNKSLFEMIVADNKAQQEAVLFERTGASRMSAVVSECRTQKAKDDISIDWLRHRVNALEKQNAVLMMKATGVAMPVPEIVADRPGTMTVPDFETMPSFEDVGDGEARRLGIKHTDDGVVEYVK